MSILRPKYSKQQLSETTNTARCQSCRVSPNRFDNQVVRFEMKESQYLSHKSQHMMANNSTLKAENQRLVLENQRLLALNSEYLSCVNRHYEDRMNKIQKVIFPTGIANNDQLDSLLRDSLQRTIASFKKMESDHNKLIKHLSVIEKENIYLKSQVLELSKIRKAMAEVNHTDVYKMAKELKEIEGENQQLRTNNNDRCYDVEKQKLDLDKLESENSQLVRQNERNKKQIDECRATINKLNQQLRQIDAKHQRKVHVLESKCSEFQRSCQEDSREVEKSKRVARRCQMQNVESVRRENNLHATIHELVREMEQHDMRRINGNKRLSHSVLSTKSARSARKKSLTQNRTFL